MIFIYSQSINSLTIIYESNVMVKTNMFINEGFLFFLTIVLDVFLHPILMSKQFIFGYKKRKKRFSFRFWVKKKRRHGLEASSMDNLNSLLKSKHRTPASKALRLIKYFFHLARKDLFSILRPPGKSKLYIQLITWFNTIPQVLNNSIFEKLSTRKKKL